MDPSIAAGLSSLAGVLVGGLLTYSLNRQQFQNQLAVLREQNKAEFMAETTARHLLSHAGYTDRSFKTLQRQLGGFGNDELRKILVRAGAVRVFHDDGAEFWRLTERTDEAISRRELARGQKVTHPQREEEEGRD